MDEKKASEVYYQAVALLNEVIEGGQRGSREEILDELEGDLEEP